MSFVDWFRKKMEHKTEHLLYVPISKERVSYTDKTEPDATELKAGNHYFRLWLVQMFLKNDRQWFAAPTRKAHERDKRATETRLRGWACEIRTQKCRRKLSL